MKIPDAETVCNHAPWFFRGSNMLARDDPESVALKKDGGEPAR
jgi:hypothetical protein